MGRKKITDIVLVEDNTNTGTIISTGILAMTYKGDGSTWTYHRSGVGGIVGFGLNCEISNSKNSGVVNVPNCDYSFCDGIGGIVGEIKNSKITSCYNSATIGEINDILDTVGGIVGLTSYNSYINNCYNTGNINGNLWIGGICGFGSQLNIKYCYNTGKIEGNSGVGGILGRILPIESNSFTNNYIYYCYNIGKVTGTTNVGSISGQFNCCDIDYVYSLTGTQSSQWGTVGKYINATNQGIYDKELLTSTVLSNFGSNFKSDYTGTDSINSGYPILSWQ